MREIVQMRVIGSKLDCLNDVIELEKPMKDSMDKELVLRISKVEAVGQTEGFTMNKGNPADFCFTI